MVIMKYLQNENSILKSYFTESPCTRNTILIQTNIKKFTNQQ